MFGLAVMLMVRGSFLEGGRNGGSYVRGGEGGGYVGDSGEGEGGEWTLMRIYLQSFHCFAPVPERLRPQLHRICIILLNANTVTPKYSEAGGITAFKRR